MFYFHSDFSLFMILDFFRIISSENGRKRSKKGYRVIIVPVSDQKKSFSVNI
ncbi:hypothetical protein J7J41_00490 [bacterium]|nr:hypothetical protein [bacterium]